MAHGIPSRRVAAVGMRGEDPWDWVLAANSWSMVETGDHRTFTVDSGRVRIGLGRRFRKPDRLGLLSNPSLIARDSDFIPYLDDIFGSLSHGGLFAGVPVYAAPGTGSA